MAVEKMKMLSIIGRISEIESVIQDLFLAECFEPENAGEVLTVNEHFTKVKEENPYREHYTNVKRLMQQLVIEETVTNKVKIKTLAEATSFLDKLNDDFGIANLLLEKEKLTTEIEEANSSINNMEHFASLDVDLDRLFKTKKLKVRFGRLPLESIEKLDVLNDPYLVIFPSSRDENYQWGFYLSPMDKAAEADKIFTNLFFERIRIPDYVGTPGEALVELSREKKEALEKLEEINANLAKLVGPITPKLQDACNYFRINTAVCNVKENTICINKTFVIVGWIPESRVKEVVEQLELNNRIDVEETAPGDLPNITPPTSLKNSKPFKKFEYLVKMYGIPNYKEFDPTYLVGVTYVLFFGFMFPDVGQSIVLGLVAIYMWKKMGNPMGKILIPCAVVGCISGLIFGDCFGFPNFLAGFYSKNGISALPIDAMDPVNQLPLLIGSVVFGTLMILLVIMLNIIERFRFKEPGPAIFSENGIVGFVFYLSVLMLILLKVVLKVNVPIIPYVALLIILPVLCMWFKEVLYNVVDRKNKHEFKIKDIFTIGFVEIFEILISFFSNTISYVRLGALVLVHAGTMQAIILIANMMGHNSVGYWVMIVFGNVLVICLEGLIVGVQALRLEFYEMFTRFFRGDGREFKPLGVTEIN